ncbi:hypothetical protein CRM22_008018 [Opisthorchis felineus]|uniref:C3H1-type domain-containing protein n=1 Tax=Opisthorchis felineus TaxID=147828 RepID=A0A4S2LDF0_OPIFE|nr:hypothetical protein CRM22_008018 [Opisthorchis felineus]
MRQKLKVPISRLFAGLIQIFVTELALREASPSYQRQLEEEEERERLEAAQKERDEQEWLEREARAQQEWAEEQRRREETRQKEIEAQRQIRADWERQKMTEQTAESSQVGKTSFVKDIASTESDTTGLPPWHHPPLPATAPVPPPVNSFDRPPQERCSFFRKTGTCRYGLSCSRRHDYPQRVESVVEEDGAAEDGDHSCIVLCIPHMFTHPHLPPPDAASGELEDSGALSADEESVLCADYMEFYHDVRDELEARWGRVAALRTCRNRTEHLRGTVYVEFVLGSGATWDAAEACAGRWFAGRQLTCMVVRLGGGWREAICGLHHRRRCPKGDSKCNFLHVFLNPGETVTDLHHALKLQLGELPPSERGRESTDRQPRNTCGSPFSSSRRSAYRWRSRSRSPRRHRTSDRHRRRSSRSNSTDRSGSRSSSRSRNYQGRRFHRSRSPSNRSRSSGKEHKKQKKRRKVHSHRRRSPSHSIHVSPPSHSNISPV